MKHFLILLLLKLCSVALVFSQATLQEFVIEEDDNPQVFYKGKGCTPDVGVIVFYTTIPDLKFSMPDTPSRLKNVSAFDKENNCYVLCIQPTDTKIGGIIQYSITITGTGYKPMPAFMVSDINAGKVQYFNIKLKEDWKSAFESLKKEIDKMKGENGSMTSSNEQNVTTDNKTFDQVTKRTPEYPSGTKELNFIFKGVDSSVKLFLNNQFIGEANFDKGFQFKYINTKQGEHKLRVVWGKYEWNGVINTTTQTDFIFEYKKKKTGFGYEAKFELVK